MYRSLLRHIEIVCIGTVLAAALAACACKPKQTVAITPVGESGVREKRAQTVLIYMVGSDLESDGGAATGDMEEMRLAKPDPSKANILLYTGGAQKWWSDVSAEQNTLFCLDGVDLSSVGRTQTYSMGDPETLTAFLQYAYDNFPADTYSLILWDHGGGPIEGYGYDELHAYDHLTLPEIRQALMNSPFGKDKQKLNFVGLDACLMASVETADVFADFADYLIASQEAVPNQGWNYAFLSEAGKSLTDGRIAARSIIDSFADYYEAQNETLPNSRKTISLSCLDLSAMRSVEQALDDLFSRLSPDVGASAFSSIAKCRGGMKTFGRFTLGRDSGLVDLTELARAFSGEAPAESEALVSALQSLVVYQRTNQEQVNGVSVFFPYENRDYLALDTEGQFAWQDIYGALRFAPQYAKFLYRFSREETGEPLTNWTGDAAPLAVADMQTGEYYLQLTAEQAANFEKASFSLLKRFGGEEYSFLLSSSATRLDENHRLYADFDGKAIYLIEPGTGQTVMPAIYEDERVGSTVRYACPAILVRSTDGDFPERLNVELLIEQDLTAQAVAVVGARLSDSEETPTPGGKRDVSLSDWDEVMLFNFGRYVTRDETGTPINTADWVSSQRYEQSTLFLGNGLLAAYKPLQADAGELYCQIGMRDTQGNRYYSALLPVPEAPETPAPAPRTPVTVTYAMGDAPVPLYEDKLCAVTLEGIAPPGYGSLVMTFRVENRGESELHFQLLRPFVNDCRQTCSAGVTVPAGGAKQCELYIDIASQHYSSLYLSGIDRVNNISLSLEYYSEDGRLPDCPVSIETDIDVSAEFPGPNANESAFPFTPQTLYDHAGRRIALREACINYAGKALYLTLDMVNDGEPFSRATVAHTSVNNVMLEDSLSGVTVYGPFPAGKRCSVGLMIDIDELFSYGQLRLTTLEFSVSVTESDGSVETEWVKLTPASEASLLHIPLAGEITCDLGSGRVVLDRGGLRITQLAGAAPGTYGKIFYVENNTPYLLSIMEHNASLNGEETNAISLYYESVAPGKCAYMTLYSTWDDASIGGGDDVVTLQFVIVDAEANALLSLTEPVTLTFRR